MQGAKLICKLFFSDFKHGSMDAGFNLMFNDFDTQYNNLIHKTSKKLRGIINFVIAKLD